MAVWSIHPRLRILATLAALGLGLSLAVKYLLNLAAPLLLGLVVAVVVEPAVRRLEIRHGFSRRAAAGFVLTFVSLAGLAVLVLAGAEIWAFLQRFVRAEDGRELLRHLEELTRGAARSLSTWPAPFGQMLPALLRELPVRALDAAQFFLLKLSRFWEWGLIICLGLAAAHYFCRRRSDLARAIWAMTPPEWRLPAAAMRGELLDAMAGYLRTLGLLSLMAAGAGAFGLWLLGLGPALLLGAIIGLLDILPLFGPGALLLPWAGALWILGRPGQALGLVALFAALAAGREIAQAKLIGSSLELQPLAILAAVYIGLKLYGPAGVMIGPFLLTVLRGLYYAIIRTAPAGQPIVPGAGFVHRT